MSALSGTHRSRTAGDLHRGLRPRDPCFVLGATTEPAPRFRAGGRLQLCTSASVRILGKGNKWRVCPLWPATVKVLRPLVAGQGLDDPVFRSRTGEQLTRFGIHRLVTTYADAASKTVPTLITKRARPHSLRHMTAVHLLRAGVDINTIRAWLGHVSLETTNIYAEIDLEMKAKALASVDITDLATAPRRARSQPPLMAFLQQL